MVKKWNRKKKDCRNCKHFYVCCYFKKWNVESFLREHLGDCMDMNDIKAQEKSYEIVNKLFCKHCKYFNKDAFSNTYTWSKKQNSHKSSKEKQ